MPVLFRCCRCHSVLKVARRKVGREVQCPRCQTHVIVPSSAVVVSRTRAGSPAGVGSGGPSSPTTPAGELNEEDVLEWLDAPPGNSLPQPPELELEAPAGGEDRSGHSGTRAGSLPPQLVPQRQQGQPTQASVNSAPPSVSEPPAHPRRSVPPPQSPVQTPAVRKPASPGTATSKPASPPESSIPARAAPRTAGPTADVSPAGQSFPAVIPPDGRPTPGPPPPPSPASGRPLVIWALEAESGQKTPPYVLI